MYYDFINEMAVEELRNVVKALQIMRAFKKEIIVDGEKEIVYETADEELTITSDVMDRVQELAIRYQGDFLISTMNWVFKEDDCSPDRAGYLKKLTEITKPKIIAWGVYEASNCYVFEIARAISQKEVKLSKSELKAWWETWNRNKNETKVFNEAEAYAEYSFCVLKNYYGKVKIAVYKKDLAKFVEALERDRDIFN